MTDSEERVSKLDLGVAHTARTWNYWLGGKDNFAAGRQVGEEILQFLPNMRIAARADRAFLGRAMRYLAGEAGIRQFLDVGTGLPTADNTHEVAQSVAPSRELFISTMIDASRVVRTRFSWLRPPEAKGHRVADSMSGAPLSSATCAP